MSSGWNSNQLLPSVSERLHLAICCVSVGWQAFAISPFIRTGHLRAVTVPPSSFMAGRWLWDTKTHLLHGCRHIHTLRFLQTVQSEYFGQLFEVVSLWIAVRKSGASWMSQVNWGDLPWELKRMEKQVEDVKQQAFLGISWLPFLWPLHHVSHIL